MKEKDLFPPLKKYFKDEGYKVYAEVPCFFRGVDFVVVRGEEHIAVEMKMSFNWEVIRQAENNIISFGRSYLAYPTKKPLLIENSENYWKLGDRIREKIEYCRNNGIGILQVFPRGNVLEVLAAIFKKPYRVFDFSQFTESENDEAGLPFQKGVSAGYYELKAIKEYIKKNPKAGWKEIFEKVQNHYSSPQSLARSMSQWRGFNLKQFKNTIIKT